MLVRINELPRWVLPALLSLWVLMPGIRRVIDLPLGFSALPVIAIVPLMATSLLFFSLFRKTENSPPLGFLIVLCAWIIGFGFSLTIALLAGSRFSGLYDAAQFLVPMLVGLMVVRSSNPRRAFEDVARACLWLGAFVGVYGIYQFVSPPPWDAVWVINSGLLSVGNPFPFSLRVFSTLNSPAICGTFLALAMLFQLPYLAGRNAFWRIVAMCIMTVGLVLTLDRSAWLALAVGVVAYVALSPRRGRAVAVIGVVSALAVGLVVVSPTLLGNAQVLDTITRRLTTFGDVSQDSSYLDRQLQTKTALRQGFDEPLGTGLGSVGTSTKLSDVGATTVLDTGYLSRFVEMGFLGTAAYAVALLGGLGVAISAWGSARRMRDHEREALAAVCVAVQLGLMGLDLSIDSHNALPGMFFWFTLALAAVLLPRPDPRVVLHRLTVKPSTL